MLCSAKTFNRQKLIATDGMAGGVYDVLFHDTDWRMSYVVVDVGTWLEGKRVLVLPSEVLLDARTEPGLAVKLNKPELARRPHIDTDPSSLTPDEIRIPPAVIPRRRAAGDELDFCTRAGGRPVFSELPPPVGDDLVRSVNRTLGYRFECVDGFVGLVDDILLEVGGWALGYLILNVGTWLHPRKVIFPVTHIDSVHWFQERMIAAVSKEVILEAPSFDCRHGIDPRCIAVADAHFAGRIEK